MKKPTKDLSKKLINEAERGYKFMQDLVDKHELQPYLNDGDIRGNMVDDSDDITPEQVAILGAYTMAKQLFDNLTEIAEGKEPKRKKETTIEVKAMRVGKDGKHEEIPMDEVPDDIKKLMKEVIDKEMSDEKE